MSGCPSVYPPSASAPYSDGTTPGWSGPLRCVLSPHDHDRHLNSGICWDGGMPERLHDLAARTRKAIGRAELTYGTQTPESVADRERLASDLAAYDLAVEGLALCRQWGDSLNHADRYTTLRDAAEANVERTARLYGVEP